MQISVFFLPKEKSFLGYLFSVLSLSSAFGHCREGTDALGVLTGRYSTAEGRFHGPFWH